MNTFDTAIARYRERAMRIDGDYWRERLSHLKRQRERQAELRKALAEFDRFELLGMSEDQGFYVRIMTEALEAMEATTAAATVRAEWLLETQDAGTGAGEPA